MSGGRASRCADRIGIALGGRRNGRGWLVSCPCPDHGQARGDRTPSLSVTDADDGRLLLRCFAGCTFGAILDQLRRRALIDDRPPSSSNAAVSTFKKPTTHEPAEAALKIWRDADSAAGTPVQAYLARRGIKDIPPTIRCGWVFHLGRVRMPVMVSAVQRPDGKLVSTHTTILTHAGKKAAVAISKITHGALGFGAFRGGPAGAVVGLAEGVETALSVQIMSGVSVWASLGATRLDRVELPQDVREVFIFGDNDAPGRDAADRAAAAHRAMGRKAVLRFPPDGVKDFNDLLVTSDRPEGCAA